MTKDEWLGELLMCEVDVSDLRRDMAEALFLLEQAERNRMVSTVDTGEWEDRKDRLVQNWQPDGSAFPDLMVDVEHKSGRDA